MLAAVFQRPGEMDVMEVDTPEIGPDEVLVKVGANTICGTDVRIFRGEKTKGIPLPTILGHEVAGRVVESSAAKFKVGDRVVVAHHVPCGRCHYCCHGNISMCAEFKKTNLDPGGFAEFVRVPVEHVESVAFPIPDSLTDNEASFMEPLACCVRAVKRAGIQPSDVVVVVGLGSIGLLFMQLIRHAGGKCIGLDLDPARRELADSLRSTATFAGSEPDFEESLASMTNGRGADAVLLTAANPPNPPRGPQAIAYSSYDLVPVEVAPDDGRPRRTDRAGVIEIAFGCGARVRLRGEVSSETLRQVIELLR